MWKKLLGGGALIALAMVAAAAAYVFWLGTAGGQPDFFESEIAAFEREDAAAPPAPGGIVFVGSSSIRLWETLAADMAPLPVVRRGFGGAHMEHVLHEVDRIVTPYEPRAVVVFVGGNDLGSGKTPERVIADFDAFARRMRRDLPAADLWLLSLKPSPWRFERWPEMEAVNAALRRMADSDERVRFLDVAHVLLGPDGTPRDDLFRFDGLHLNREGYAAWTRIVRPALLAAYGPDARASRR